ncbi:hypothetical protein IWGMT90018_01290 [Mycobacterium kiyosense]|nr:hypothetical protein IWGMT90018_01290 [Mycobacterium kiyosense]
MPIDVDKALGAVLPQRRSSWSATDVILYHLGLGAGSVPTDPAELAYTYEGRLRVPALLRGDPGGADAARPARCARHTGRLG